MSPSPAGARVVATDPSPAARTLAREFGAEVVVDPGRGDPVAEIADRTAGGAHASFDAVGLAATCEASIRCLRRRGRHVQIGLLPSASARPAVPMDLVIAHELQILGSHGMAAHDYPRLLALVGFRSLPARPAGRPDAAARGRAPCARRRRHRHGGGGHRAAS